MTWLNECSLHLCFAVKFGPEAAILDPCIKLSHTRWGLEGVVCSRSSAWRRRPASLSNPVKVISSIGDLSEAADFWIFKRTNGWWSYTCSRSNRDVIDGDIALVTSARYSFKYYLKKQCSEYFKDLFGIVIMQWWTRGVRTPVSLDQQVCEGALIH